MLVCDRENDKTVHPRCTHNFLVYFGLLKSEADVGGRVSRLELDLMKCRARLHKLCNQREYKERPLCSHWTIYFFWADGGQCLKSKVMADVGNVLRWRDIFLAPKVSTNLTQLIQLIRTV